MISKFPFHFYKIFVLVFTLHRIKDKKGGQNLRKYLETGYSILGNLRNCSNELL